MANKRPEIFGTDELNEGEETTSDNGNCPRKGATMVWTSGKGAAMVWTSGK
jgi:hypothetical protein